MRVTAEVKEFDSSDRVDAHVLEGRAGQEDRREIAAPSRPSPLE
ncbi:hypothetical protein [Streptomyces thioluteus]